MTLIVSPPPLLQVPLAMEGHFLHQSSSFFFFFFFFFFYMHPAVPTITYTCTDVLTPWPPSRAMNNILICASNTYTSGVNRMSYYELRLNNGAGSPCYTWNRCPQVCRCVLKGGLCFMSRESPMGKILIPYTKVA